MYAMNFFLPEDGEINLDPIDLVENRPLFYENIFDELNEEGSITNDGNLNMFPTIPVCDEARTNDINDVNNEVGYSNEATNETTIEENLVTLNDVLCKVTRQPVYDTALKGNYSRLQRTEERIRSKRFPTGNSSDQVYPKTIVSYMERGLKRAKNNNSYVKIDYQMPAETVQDEVRRIYHGLSLNIVPGQIIAVSRFIEKTETKIEYSSVDNVKNYEQYSSCYENHVKNIEMRKQLYCGEAELTFLEVLQKSQRGVFLDAPVGCGKTYMTAISVIMRIIYHEQRCERRHRENPENETLEKVNREFFYQLFNVVCCFVNGGMVLNQYERTFEHVKHVVSTLYPEYTVEIQKNMTTSKSKTINLDEYKLGKKKILILLSSHIEKSKSRNALSRHLETISNENYQFLDEYGCRNRIFCYIRDESVNDIQSDVISVAQNFLITSATLSEEEFGFPNDTGEHIIFSKNSSLDGWFPSQHQKLSNSLVPRAVEDQRRICTFDVRHFFRWLSGDNDRSVDPFRNIGLKHSAILSSACGLCSNSLLCPDSSRSLLSNVTLETEEIYVVHVELRARHDENQLLHNTSHEGEMSMRFRPGIMVLIDFIQSNLDGYSDILQNYSLKTIFSDNLGENYETLATIDVHCLKNCIEIMRNLVSTATEKKFMSSFFQTMMDKVTRTTKEQVPFSSKNQSKPKKKHGEEKHDSSTESAKEKSLRDILFQMLESNGLSTIVNNYKNAMNTVGDIHQNIKHENVAKNYKKNKLTEKNTFQMKTNRHIDNIHMDSYDEKNVNSKLSSVEYDHNEFNGNHDNIVNHNIENHDIDNNNEDDVNSLTKYLSGLTVSEEITVINNATMAKEIEIITSVNERTITGIRRVGILDWISRANENVLTRAIEKLTDHFCDISNLNERFDNLLFRLCGIDRIFGKNQSCSKRTKTHNEKKDDNNDNNNYDNNDNDSEDENDEEFQLMDSFASSFQCAVCLVSKQDDPDIIPCITNCCLKREMCKGCINILVESKNRCPFCRTENFGCGDLNLTFSKDVAEKKTIMEERELVSQPADIPKYILHRQKALQYSTFSAYIQNRMLEFSETSDENNHNHQGLKRTIIDAKAIVEEIIYAYHDYHHAKNLSEPIRIVLILNDLKYIDYMQSNCNGFLSDVSDPNEVRLSVIKTQMQKKDREEIFRWFYASKQEAEEHAEQFTTRSKRRRTAFELSQNRIKILVCLRERSKRDTITGIDFECPPHGMIQILDNDSISSDTIQAMGRYARMNIKEKIEANQSDFHYYTVNIH